MDKNAILAMILALSIAACMVIGVISVIIILYKNSKASEGMHLCEFAKIGGGCYTKLLPIDENGVIEPPQEHKEKYAKGNKGFCYVTDKMHTFIARYPEGWPRFLQTKVGKSYYEEGDSNPRLPALRDPHGKVLGLQDVISADMLFNLRSSKVGSELRGYGDREREISQALKGYLKPVIFYIVSLVLFITLLANIILQWQGNRSADHFYSQYTTTAEQEPRDK